MNGGEFGGTVQLHVYHMIAVIHYLEYLYTWTSYDIPYIRIYSTLPRVVI